MQPLSSMREEMSPGNAPVNGKAHGPKALDEAWNDTARLAHYLSAYLGLIVDQRKLSLKEGVVRAVAGLAAVMATGMIAAVSVVFILLGIAQGIGNLVAGGLPYPMWAGLLATGASCLIVIGAVAGYQVSKLRKAALKKRMEQYANLGT